MRYKVICSYDGNNYVGFQSQKNGKAIQDVIEEVIYHIFDIRLRIIMSSRTDAGVHAKGQVFHFDIEEKMDTYKLKGAFNALLPKDIHVKKVEIVSEEFHSRFSVKDKTYEYLINIGEYDVFLNGYAYQCKYKLDIDLMKKACKLFEGKHDFGSFNTSSYKEYPNQIRDIKEFKLIKKGNMLKFKITGDGFLRNMVRIMVGSLVDLGRGKKSMKELKDMLNNPSKTTKRNNIDPHGLYLIKIRY